MLLTKPIPGSASGNPEKFQAIQAVMIVDQNGNPLNFSAGSGTGGSTTMQGAYDLGSHIQTTAQGGALWVTTWDPAETGLLIDGPTGKKALEAKGDGTLGNEEGIRGLKTVTLPDNQTGILMDATPLATARTVIINYSAYSADNASFQTGQLWVTRIGASTQLTHTEYGNFGIQLGLTFTAQIDGDTGDLEILVDTAPAGTPRDIHFLKLLLP